MNPADNWAERIARHINPDGTVSVPPRIAYWLESQAGLTADRRIGLRMTDPEAYEALAALHIVALSHGSASGTKPAEAQDESADLTQWITTQQAAAQLGITTRAIRKRCTAGQLQATRHGNRWLIQTAQLNSHKLTA
ncbi:hypothetical protein BST33_10030 [Mycolicibacter minnesotensis]|uniref:Uncharacterized protein n=1 Tax=Mycolicibacter minnesotensis TaxID=1118379 RepID=A0A7I7R3Z9_9MYCO|nr:helix-turn-helix domain-containing protein [Mycolicibacter minnesotensis]ORB01097.1 hypothetical protein BST33_10030 [Mycolicibacter minnesotensis]BBY33359.1 hypothetical protein MMIN_14200 [Mycolicibacter minnesotensis]